MATSNNQDPQQSPHLIQSPQLLSATYSSPTNPAFTSSHSLPPPSTAKTSDRTAYLATLRKAVSAMQEDINTELTARMEEDKTREGKAKTAVEEDEKRVEDTYGEEEVGE